MTRQERLAARGLSRREEGLVERLEQIRTQMTEESAKVYAFRVGMIQDDMRDVVARLGTEDVGAGTQEAEREILRKVDQLLEGLRRLRNQQPQQGGGGGGSPGGRPRLVPPIAEFRLMRLIQQEIRERTQRVAARLRESGQAGEVERMLLQRLAREEATLSELMEEYLKMLGQQPQDPGRRDF
jgi:hypothetical protein